MFRPSIEVKVVSEALAALDSEWIIAPVGEQGTLAPLEELDAATGGELERALDSGEFKAKPCEVFITPVSAPGWKGRRVAMVGLGNAAEAGAERLRRAATAAGLAARERHAASVAFVLSPMAAHIGGTVLPETAGAAAEGLLFALFDAGIYKTANHEPWQPSSLYVSVPGLNATDCAVIGSAVERASVVGDATNLARELAIEPGNRLRPRAFAERAAAVAAHYGVRAEVLDEARIAELGMGLLSGVAQGSQEPPRLLVLRYEPADAPGSPVLGLVGKGVTFDTGGISIKPALGMERMKDDMAGGAAVVAALCAISRLRAPRRVIGVVPIAENMPGGDAIRPGDVLKSASGKTVEVLDTDAEGRLILADALWYARRLGATHVVDIATLTGACLIALGKITTGLFGRPQRWVDTIVEVAAAAGDRVWPLPLFEEYREQLRSDIADLVNVGGRPAGAITAAIFLSEFAGEGAWSHLDIAGTAWAEEASAYLPKGPSGVCVRTLIRLAFAELAG